MLLPRERAITPQDFVARFLAPRQPVVIADEVPTWPAHERWTWDYLVQRIGQHRVDICDDWFEPSASSTFAEFVAANIGVPGTSRQRYVRWFSRCRPDDDAGADSVLAALAQDWSAPSFFPQAGYVVPHVVAPSRIDPTVDLFPYRALFVSGSGARTRLHLDPWASSAVLCQVVGEKRVLMWPPAEHATMLAISEGGRTGQGSGVPARYDDVLHAGEILLVPAGWWHEVDTLTDAVSITWNFVHESQAEALLAHVEASPDDTELEVAAFFLPGDPGDGGSAKRLVDHLTGVSRRRAGVS